MFRAWLDDATLTVTLDDPTQNLFGIVSYVPKTPDVRVTSAPGQGDGTDVSNVEYENVSDTMRLFVQGAPSQVRAIVTQINTLFERARKKISTVYLELEPDTQNALGDIWRSQVFYGRASLDEDALATWQLPDWLFIDIELTRQYYWEKSAESELPLALANGTPVTGGITLQNTYDSTRKHWFTIAPSAIIGDLPAGARIELTNTYTNGNGSNTFYIGRSANAPTATQNLILEAESATSTYGGVINDASNSNGQSRSLSWNGTTAVDVLQWGLSSGLLNALAGGFYRVLMRTNALAPNGYWVRLVLKVNSISPVQVTPWVQLNSWQLQEIGTLQLPPYVMHGGDAYPLDLHLEVRSISAGANALAVDFLALLPTECYRVLMSKGYQTPQNAILVDDGMSGDSYTRNAGIPSTARLGNYIPYGAAITLQPGTLNSLYILCDAANTTHQVARTTSVRMWVRPRRLTI